MRFLDLDLDFFLNENPYCSGSDSGRLGSEYKPWSVSRVRRFLEDRCGLSRDTPVPGRTIESHERVIDFLRMLIESGRLRVRFELIHVDAHPDLTVTGGLYMESGLLYMNSGSGQGVIQIEQVHSGNYLTFAIASGWVASLIWVPLRKTLKDLPNWYMDVEYGLRQLKGRKGGGLPATGLSVREGKSGVPFKILLWHKFRTSETFDYMALSKSPNFTPPESDALIPVVEGYMRQI